VVSTLLVCSLLALGQAAPDGTAAAELKTKVLALVRQLDSDEQPKREAAEKELVALGPDVLALLPDLKNPRMPAEVKNRLTRVENALMKAAIEATTRTALVTLSGEMPVSQALAELTKQSGNRLVDYRERFNQEIRDPKVKIALDKVPFWQALDTVLDAAELSIYNYDEEAAALAYTSRGEESVARAGRAAYSGLFRLEPTRIEAARDLRNPAMRSLKLFVDAAWEPRVRPIVLEQPLDQVQAQDENGKPIEVDGSEGTLEVPVEGTNAGVELEIPLMAPERSVKQLATLSGKLTAVVLGKVEAFEFTDLDKLKAAEQERGGVTVTLEQCRKNGDIYDVNMRVRFDKAANALESHRGWIYSNECYLTDAKGQRIENAGLEATLLDVNEVGLSYKFDLGDATPAGHKFVYKTPAAIIKLPVPFELKGIDLP
jgi:hypothetical protein